MATKKTGTEPIMVPIHPENELLQPVTTVVNAADLQSLIAQLQEYKSDITTLVTVFNGLQSLFSGKGGLMSIVPVITRLLNDKNKMNELAAIVPVMEKYIQAPKPNENEQ